MEEVQEALHKMEQAAHMLESEDSFRFFNFKYTHLLNFLYI